MTVHAGLPALAFADAAGWEAWLAAQPVDSPGVWLMVGKAGTPSVTKAEAIDAALCHGWIDGQLGRWDERHYLIRFTPRTPRSLWSAKNRARALELIEAARMTPAGQAAIDAASVGAGTPPMRDRRAPPHPTICSPP